MKKLLCLILSAVLVFSGSATALGAFLGNHIVLREMLPVYERPDITSKKIAEVTKNTVVLVTETRNDVFGKIYLHKDGIYGWVQLGALQAIYSPVTDTSVDGIKITSLPSKRTYVDGIEELDLTGLTVYTTKNGSNVEKLLTYNVYAPEMKGPGEKTVKITYSPDGKNLYSDSFTVTVERVKVTKISIVALPTLRHKEHGRLDLTGLKISTEFENPALNTVKTYAEIKNDPDYIIKGCHNEQNGSRLEKGTHTFTVEYKYPDVFCAFKIEVAPRSLASIALKNDGAADNLTVYSNTAPPSIDKLTFIASYDNGETEEISGSDCTVKCNPSEFRLGPGNEAEVWFGDKYTKISFSYSLVSETGIRAVPPAVLSFFYGEEADLSALKVYLCYNDGEEVEIRDFTIDEIDYTLKGDQRIFVRYKNYSTFFTINIDPYCSKGDVDSNGKVNAKDARLALRAAVEIITLSGNAFFAADTDRNDKISANDARRILRHSVGLDNVYITVKNELQ